MRTPTALIHRIVVIAGLLMPTCLLTPAADAEQTPDGLPPGQPLTAPVSILQVTGTANRITISATHADVLSALKLVLTQAHRQFAPDNTVDGEVTLALTNQPLATVLDAICSQLFLKYQVDQHGIYRFSRDDRKLQEAFVRMRGVNALLDNYLRSTHYNLSTAAQNAPAGAPGPAGPAGRVGGNVGSGGSGGFGGSGFGGGAANSAAAPQLKLRGDLPVPHAETKESVQIQRQSPAQRSVDSVGDKLAASPNEAGLQQNIAAGSTMLTYGQFLQSSGQVGVHIPSDKPEPVVSVLKQFSQQSGVPIIIDPGIPNGLRFRFWGTIVRPLPDAMNLLATVAHLEWRQVGGQIFVTTTPDFQIYFGESNIPAAAYPLAPAASSQASSAQSRQKQAQSLSAPTHKTVKPRKKDDNE